MTKGEVMAMARLVNNQLHDQKIEEWEENMRNILSVTPKDLKKHAKRIMACAREYPGECPEVTQDIIDQVQLSINDRTTSMGKINAIVTHAADQLSKRII